ncbi:coiled-coil domain-containing protein 63 [Apteryx rowi]|uniref:coiled-coil domain-containing protein 63 n=1 Tax=Apteryx rowi TaxID=308060 RepID=UPI000E1C91C3|nr:coiled-coil domain-containing protein 63 [Apteryx rowi]
MKGSKQWRGSSLRKTVSDFTAKEKEKMAEAELGKLQQRFRILAESRKSFGANMKHRMYSQEKEINSLKQEHKEMSLMLSHIKSPRNLMLDDRNRTEFKFLLRTKDHYDSLIRARKDMLADLDKKIMEMEKKITRQNLIAAKVKHASSSKGLQKQIQTLEMRLNHVTVHFNTILSINTKLRGEIENLRIQKAILDNFYLNLHKKLDQQNRRMNIVTEQSTQAYEQRVEALARTSATKERHCKDTVQYNIELQERERILDQETKLKTFMLIKFMDRSELKEQAKKEEALKAVQRAKRRQGESFESREVAYRRLLELAENGDIDRLVKEFIEKEEKNFAYFSYTTELNNEMERLQRKIRNLQNEIMLLEMDQDNAESSDLHILKELEEKLRKTTEEANQYEHSCKESGKILGQLKSAVELLFKEMNCDATKIKEQLGENGEITDLNLLQFFNIIEKKTNELLLLASVLRYAEAEAEAEGEQDALPFTNPLLGGTGLLKTMDRARLCPPPPGFDRATESTETLPLRGGHVVEAVEEPLDHDSLRSLILESQEERSNATDKGKKAKSDANA